MACVLLIDGRRGSGVRPHDYNVFLRGGVVDGDGLASCVNVKGFAHYTLRDCTFLNGREYGLRVDGGYEMIAENVYWKRAVSSTSPARRGNSSSEWSFPSPNAPGGRRTSLTDATSKPCGLSSVPRQSHAP